jgi:hypothetical protein
MIERLHKSATKLGKKIAKTGKIGQKGLRKSLKKK